MATFFAEKLRTNNSNKELVATEKVSLRTDSNQETAVTVLLPLMTGNKTLATTDQIPSTANYLPLTGGTMTGDLINTANIKAASFKTKTVSISAHPLQTATCTLYLPPIPDDRIVATTDQIPDVSVFLPLSGGTITGQVKFKSDVINDIHIPIELGEYRNTFYIPIYTSLTEHFTAIFDFPVDHVCRIWIDAILGAHGEGQIEYYAPANEYIVKRIGLNPIEIQTIKSEEVVPNTGKIRYYPMIIEDEALKLKASINKGNWNSKFTISVRIICSTF